MGVDPILTGYDQAGGPYMFFGFMLLPKMSVNPYNFLHRYGHMSHFFIEAFHIQVSTTQGLKAKPNRGPRISKGSIRYLYPAAGSSEVCKARACLQRPLLNVNPCALGAVSFEYVVHLSFTARCSICALLLADTLRIRVNTLWALVLLVYSWTIHCLEDTRQTHTTWSSKPRSCTTGRATVTRARPLPRA